jgi:hypothetical protein
VSDGSIENLVLRTIERWWAGRYSEKHGLVTSYDPDKYLAKVTFQPEGQESGWLPIETGHIGNSYGIAIGLQPGDGKETGDQVVVRYQEGDVESGKIVQRVHSDKEKPPKVESGEAIIWTKFKKSGGGDNAADGGEGGTGQQIFLKKDGSLVVTDGNGATITLDGKGNIAIVCKDFTVTASGNALVKADGAAVIEGANTGVHGTNLVEVKSGGILGLDGIASVICQGKGDVNGTSVTSPQPQPTIPPWMVPA